MVVREEFFLREEKNLINHPRVLKDFQFHRFGILVPQTSLGTSHVMVGYHSFTLCISSY